MPREPITVSVLFRRVQRALDDEFRGAVLVTGEVRKLQVRGDGNCWFELVEPGGGNRGRDAALPVVCWARTYGQIERRLARHGLALTEGSAIIAGGVVRSWTGGRLQFDLQFVDIEAMIGRLAATRAAIRERLEAEGLVEANRRVRWPLVPLRVGLVASRDSEGMRDFLGVLRASSLGFHVTWCHAAVQGPEAPRQIARAIGTVGAAEVDAVVVVRGGGSASDLAAFDAELVARAIATCTRPVVVGIGHTGDRPLADELAHSAHATPTAAAHHLVEAVRAYAGALDDRVHRISVLARRSADRARHQIDVAAERLPLLAERAVADGQRDTAVRMRTLLDAARRRHDHERAGVMHRARALDRTGRARHERVADAVAAQRAQLRAFDPQRSLERGYAIASDAHGSLLRSAAAVSVGELVTIRLAEGTITARVERVDPQEQQ